MQVLHFIEKYLGYKIKNPVFWTGFRLTLNGFLGNDCNVCSLEAFRSLLNFKLDFVALIEGFVAVAGDSFEVDEYIFAACT
jgi:hypothetical protein